MLMERESRWADGAGEGWGACYVGVNRRVEEAAVVVKWEKILVKVKICLLAFQLNIIRFFSEGECEMDCQKTIEYTLAI